VRGAGSVTLETDSLRNVGALSAERSSVAGKSAGGCKRLARRRVAKGGRERCEQAREGGERALEDERAECGRCSMRCNTESVA
jgi:hypothetical protein